MKIDNPKFISILNSLKKKTITAVTAGSDNEGIVVLDFGESHSLFIHCAWRLSRYDKVLTTWNDAVVADEEEEEDELEAGAPVIKKIEGLTLEDIEIGDFFDLKITLGKAYRLDVFCDLYSNDEVSDFDENWSVSDVADNVCFVVTENYKLIETKYNTEVPL
jgi:hypothetical protein